MTVAKTLTLFKKVRIELGQGLVATSVQVVLPKRPVAWDGGSVECWVRVLLNGSVWIQGLSVIRDEKKRVYRLTVPGWKAEWQGRQQFRPYVNLQPAQRKALLQAALELVKEAKAKAEASQAKAEAAAAKTVPQS